MKKISYISVFGVLSFAFASIVSAHSTVSPSSTTVSKYETFTLSVPVEKEVPTTNVRLVVPAGVDRVTPVVKNGWKITVKKDGADKVTEIVWSNGSIPVGQKDLFQFTARTGTEPATLIWKVYQTYQNGEVVAWDQNPKMTMEEGQKMSNPYSTTEVSKDPAVESASAKPNYNLSLTISLVALVFSIIALSKRKKQI